MSADPPKLAGHGMPLLEIENLHVEIDGKKILKGVDLAVNVEQPRQSEFGEMAVPAAFQLAKQLRQAPKKIASKMLATEKTTS